MIRHLRLSISGGGRIMMIGVIGIGHAGQKTREALCCSVLHEQESKIFLDDLFILE